MKDKSIKSTMKSWIMLSDKELDDTQVYMKEQEGENTESISEDREGIHHDRNATGDSGIYSDNDGLYSDSNEEETESDIESKQNRRGRRRRLSRDEEVEQLVQEVGQEVVGADDEEGTLFHRRKRRQDKKAAPDSENTPEIQEEHPEVKKVDFKEVTTKKAGREQQSDKTEKSGNMGKEFAAGIGIVLVLIIAGLGYQNQSLQKQNQKLNTQISALKKEKKQAEQQEQFDAIKQTVSMLIIDKGRVRVRDAGFPPIVVENTPKYLRRSKVPVVKAKVGPKVMTLMCDAQIYPIIPVKKEVKATISGIYITGVKGLRGPLDTPEKKKGFFARLRNK